MVSDVADALLWIQQNDHLVVSPAITNDDDDDDDADNNSIYNEDDGGEQQETSSCNGRSATSDGDDGQHQQQQRRRPIIVFGGYSSGAHVAATLLHSSRYFDERGMLRPERWIDSVFVLIRRIGNSRFSSCRSSRPTR